MCILPRNLILEEECSCKKRCIQARKHFADISQLGSWQVLCSKQPLYRWRCDCTTWPGVLPVCRDLASNTMSIPVPPVAWPSRTSVKPMDEPWRGSGVHGDRCWDMAHVAGGCPGWTSEKRIAAKGFARMSTGGSTIYFIWIIHD